MVVFPFAAITLMLLGGAALAAVRMRRHRGRQASPTIGLRRREDARDWQNRFIENSVCGENFHRPTQNEIWEILHSLDQMTPNWELGDPDVVTHRFLNELAEGCPSLCKDDCRFPTPIPQDLPASLRGRSLADAAVADHLKTQRDEAAATRERLRLMRAHANALKQFASPGPIDNLKQDSWASPIQDTAQRRGRKGWFAWAAGVFAVGCIVLISVGLPKLARPAASPAENPPLPNVGDAPAGRAMSSDRPAAVLAENQPVPAVGAENPVSVPTSTPPPDSVGPNAPAAGIPAPGTAPASGPGVAATTVPPKPSHLAEEIAASKMRAVAKHPDLTVANSEINLRFVFRYKRLVEEDSPRLRDPQWPEQLADECAAASKISVLQNVPRSRH